MVPHRRTGLVRHLDPGRFEQLIASLDSSSPRGLRDRAIILCMARLGLRASEVAAAAAGGPRLAQRHGAGARPQDRSRRAAAADRPRWGRRWPDYLQHGRPDTRGAAGVRAAPAAGRRADQQQHRRPRRGQRAAACGNGCADARGEPAAPFTGHRSARSRGQPARDRRPARALRRWPPPGSTPRSMSRRCARSRCPGRRRRHDRPRHRAGRTTTSSCAVAWATARPARSARCGPSPGTWTRTATTARSRWRRAWTGRHRPPRPIRATRPGGWRRCGASCVTCPRWTAPPRCPRRDCSARPGTASRRTCIPTARSRPAAGRRRAGPGRRAAAALLRHAVRADRLHRAADLRGAGADLRRRRPGRRHAHRPGRQTRPDPAGAAAPQRPGAAA